MKRKQISYPRIIERTEDWPIYKLSEDRAAFIEQVNEFTKEKLIARHKKDLDDVILKTIYLERIRMREEPWKVDPPTDKNFWNKISTRLIKKSLDRDDAEAFPELVSILERIIPRFSNEIVGTFKLKTHAFAVKFLTFFFNRLLNAAVGKSFTSLFSSKRKLYERINVEGDVEMVRALFKQGTVVVVPTHSSNLDSILVGFAMDQIMGLPSFSYGAGLNLYNSGIAAFFMNRLGAYRVDRRKKNVIYLETLKSVSNLSIQRGTNSLFFPGGTRSRSGELENDLKLGLLGTTIEAQRAMSMQGDKKVFIVPMVICYHFVLEAPYLIENYLRNKGKENYIYLRDEGTSIRSWLRFLWNFFSTTNDITLSVGRPMDVLGNFVNSEGMSFDMHGKPININEYFQNNGVITHDKQREEEFTKILAERLVERYHVENIVLTSHLVAFAVFNILVSQHPKLDLYGILRLPPDDYVFPIEVVEEVVGQLQEILKTMEVQGKIKCSEEISLSALEVIKSGVKNIGVFHQKKPLSFNKDGDIVSESFRVLFFYHNRLLHYNLEKDLKRREGSFILKPEEATATK